MAEKLWVAYTIQAMNPVKDEVTSKMLEQSKMIENLFKPVFDHQGIPTEFFVIGSLAAQTHIEPNCSIDLLVLLKNEADSMIINEEAIKDQLVRAKFLLNDQLISEFPEAKISNSHSLCLKVFHQNLTTNLCFYFGYREKNNENSYGNSSSTDKIKILDSEIKQFVDMDPIKNMVLLSQKDNLVNLNVKPLIRILKIIKKNALPPINLTGHEVTSIVYSMDNYLLEKPNGQLLFLLLECSLFLKQLEDPLYLQIKLKSPDNERLLNNDNNERILNGIHSLKNELNQLIKNLVLEIDLYTNIYEYATINP